MILIDNYDSFTYNIAEYLKELGIAPIVFKNDEIKVSELKKMNFNEIIISPGPKTPDKSGVSMDIIKNFYKTKKILGICLGHQCIAQFFGAKIIKDKNPFHGKTSKIYFDDGNKLFYNCKQGFNATRYHSLLVDGNTLPACLKITARTNSGIIMALEHNEYKVFGVQFHPEAILTEYGHQLISNFLDI